MAIKMRGIKGANGSVERDGSNGEILRKFDVWDPQVDPETPGYFQSLYAHVIANAEPVIQGLPRGRITFAEDGEGSGHFIFDVAYQSRVPFESQIKWSWDTTGGTVKMTTSRATSRYAIAGRIAPDHRGAIGVKGKEVEGVDRVIPALKLTATFRHLAGSATINNANFLAYIKTIAGLTGSTNNAVWQTFAIGELLFLGCSGEFVPDKDTEIQYHFAASKNATGLTIGQIANITKAGHDYLWVSYEAALDSGAGNALAQRPTFAYVERIYDSADFTAFGIG